MEFIIACLVAFTVFGIFFAVFLIKPQKGDGPVKVHTCARQRCFYEEKRGGVQIQPEVGSENGRRG